MSRARPAALLCAAALVAGGCGGGPTGVTVHIAPEAGLAVDQVQVEVVGRDPDGGAHPLEPAPPPYPVGGAAAGWQESVVVLAGAQSSAGADVLVIGLRDGVEVARGGVGVDFVAGRLRDADVVLRAACRGVYCDRGAYCGADGDCGPGARRLDFTVNAAGAGDQTRPRVASLGDVGWVFAWIDAAVTPPQIYTRRVGPDGAALDAADVQVEQSSLEQQDPALVAAPGGETYVVAWGESPSGRVRLRRFHSGGSPIGDAEGTSGVVDGEQLAPALGGNPAGFLVAWQDSKPPTGTGWSVRYRRGNWVAGWTDMAVGYAATSPTGAEWAPVVCGSCGGADTFLVAWQDATGADPDPSGTQIRGRWLAGSPAAGGETILNTTTPGDQITPAAGSSSSLAAVVWDDHGSSPPALRGRTCRPDVSTVSAEIVVASTGGALENARPAVAVAGQVVLVVWEAADEAGQGTVVMGRRLDAAGAPIDEQPFLVATPRYGSQSWPRAAASAGAFAIVWQERATAGAAGWEVRGRILGVADAP